MNIAVLSGKGGTGKTLISVNLAAAAEAATYVDCDVEEPNGHLYFKPNNVTEKEVAVKIPHVDPALCSGCRQCVDFCKFNALAYIRDNLIIFDEICHSCGGCVMLCPEKALSEKDKVIGKIQKGISDNVEVHTGLLKIGEPSGVPIIKTMLEDQRHRDQDSTQVLADSRHCKCEDPRRRDKDVAQALVDSRHCKRDDSSHHDKKPIQAPKVTLIDCPPGTACMVMESIQDADYCILVAEPTVFGLHNLDLVHQLVTLFNKPFGVVLNKCLGDDHLVDEYCEERSIPILVRLPFDAELGRLNAKADIAVRKSEKYRALFSNLLERVIDEVQHEATAHS
ncbi:MAG: 4Fe-4S binding protein [Clostridiaceae bacterium]|jgi:MinD superfamily P-loop ATPase|nr:4Fe-4S binding protein [Clostridiaceae bacterium]